jgi:hypothetical protein
MRKDGAPARGSPVIAIKAKVAATTTAAAAAAPI